MIRKMTNGTTTLNINEWIITKHGWEFYLTPNAEGEDAKRRFGLVMGIEVEMGEVYMPELFPYINTKATGEQLKEVMPATGWKWED